MKVDEFRMVKVMEIEKGRQKTEVGIIPNDWVVKPIGEIFEVTAGGDFKRNLSTNYQSEKFLYPIYSNSLVDSGLYGYSSYYTSEANCITVTARGTIGCANYRDHRFTAIGRVLVLKLKEDIDCFFISEYINNRIKFILEVTGVPQLTAPQISKYFLALPPTKAEQTAIATALHDADALISSVEQLIAKKHHIKQGAMQELLKPKAGWEVKMLGEIVDKFVNGGTPSTEVDKYWKGNIPWISGADVLNQQIGQIRRYITEEAVKNSSTNVIKKGNLLFVSRTGVGKLAIAPFDIAISQDFTGIYVNNDFLVTEFLYKYLTKIIFIIFC